MIDTIGWLGNLLLAGCGVPLVLSAIIKGKDKSPVSFLAIWLAGEILALVYLLTKIGLDLPLVFNYTLNICFILITLKYNLWPRNEKN